VVRLALEVLLGPGGLPDEHQLCIGIPDAKDQVGASWGELTTSADTNELAQRIEVGDLFKAGVAIEELGGRVLRRG